MPWRDKNALAVMLLFWGVGVALASTSLANEEDDQAWRLEDLEQAQSTMPIALLRDERKEDRRLVVLLDDWLYCYPPDRELYRVPRGYISDFASIPKAAQGLINPFGDQAEAAVIHDWLYAVGEEGKRPHADEIFRYALMEQGVSVVTRNIMHRSVRLGGNDAYGAEREWAFYDVENLKPMDPPIEKPATGVVQELDCDKLEVQFFELRRKHRTYDAD